MNPILSIIIPCYDSQSTLESTLESVISQDFKDWEAIIVNDGSTDGTQGVAMGFVEKDKRFRYFSKENEGLGRTRNFGIERAKGEFILPLDSDNILGKEFAKKAVRILSNCSKIGVVHGNAEYFGDRKGVWKIPKYDFEKILTKNYIDACAVYRKVLWEKIEGYDENMPFQGNEDWAFWIDLGILEVLFYHLNEVTFSYRTSDKSMINSFTPEMFKKNREYIARKYSYIYFEEYKKKYGELAEIRNSPIMGSLSLLKKRIVDLFY